MIRGNADVLKAFREKLVPQVFAERFNGIFTHDPQSRVMNSVTRFSEPEFWLDQLFATKAAQKGAVVRRSMAWVDREVGRDLFVHEVRTRGFHLIRTADQYIVVCHSGPIDIMF